MEALMGLFIVLAILYLPGCLLVHNVAGYRGLSGTSWFLAAVVCTPLLALLGVMATPEFLDYPQRQFGQRN